MMMENTQLMIKSWREPYIGISVWPTVSWRQSLRVEWRILWRCVYCSSVIVSSLEITQHSLPFFAFLLLMLIWDGDDGSHFISTISDCLLNV